MVLSQMSKPINGWIAKKLGSGIHSAKSINSNDFGVNSNNIGDPLTFSGVLSSGQNVNFV